MTPRPARLPATVTAAFAVLGLVAMWRPKILGNGKGPARLAFAGTLGLQVLLWLVGRKPLATAGCLRSGAVGGLLTSAIAFGAPLGAVPGHPWDAAGPRGPGRARSSAQRRFSR